MVVSSLSNRKLPESETVTAHLTVQLNRLVRVDRYDNLNSATNTWNSGGAAMNYYGERFSYDANGNIMTLWRQGDTLQSGSTLMDDLTYGYYANTNRLKRVTDQVSANIYDNDVDDQSDTNNYVYDAIGNLIEDKAEGLTISWNVYAR